MSNGLLKGLVRISCPSCGFGQTGMVGEVETDKCPVCGYKDINVLVGNRPVKDKQDLSKFMKEDKNMVKKYDKLIAEMKALGMNTEDLEKSNTEDATIGTVGATAPVEESEDEAVVVEKAETGKGFSIYADYNKVDSTKFKRLSRD